MSGIGTGYKIATRSTLLRGAEMWGDEFWGCRAKILGSITVSLISVIMISVTTVIYSPERQLFASVVGGCSLVLLLVFLYMVRESRRQK